MKKYTSPIIDVQELLQLTLSDAYVKIFDVSNGKDAKLNYNKKHLRDAIFVDINSQLTNIKENLSQGGRHPLPSVEKFGEVLGKLGITPVTHVVLYDDKNGANAAARFWWMLKAIGHEKVQVLDGGFQNAEINNFPINANTVVVNPVGNYPITKWNLPLISMKEVDAIKEDKTTIIIDVREENRYNGISEPIDLVAGHIPNAINVPFIENLDKEGAFLSKEILNEKYSELFKKYPAENIIVHCGSGVTACHTILAMHHAGYNFPKLYVGSWSEWSRNNNEMVLKRN